MPRKPRAINPGSVYHITQRGNYKQTVFFEDADRWYYSKLINVVAKKYGISILAYCLMNNHIHFIAIPQKEDSFAQLFRLAHMRYAQYIHAKSHMIGHLWQGRFYSKELSEEHFKRAVRYVEQNPVRAGFVKFPWDWKWSSAAEHIGKGQGSIELVSIQDFMYIGDWEAYLLDFPEQDLIEMRS